MSDDDVDWGAAGEGYYLPEKHCCVCYRARQGHPCGHLSPGPTYCPVHLPSAVTATTSWPAPSDYSGVLNNAIEERLGVAEQIIRRAAEELTELAETQETHMLGTSSGWWRERVAEIAKPAVEAVSLWDSQKADN